MAFTDQPSPAHPMPTLPDLITSGFATTFLAAAGRTLTSGQTSALASKISVASQAVRRWCGDRDFTQTTYTEIYRPSQNGEIGLRQFPVNQVLRVSKRPEGVLTIQANPNAAQIADVGFAETGDWAGGTTVTGLTLSWTSNGTASTATILYSSLSPPTLQSLVTAINALGSPWSATVGVGFASWPVTELVGGEAATGALEGTSLRVYTADAKVVRLDRGAGLLYLERDLGGDAFGGPKWGPDWGLWLDGPIQPGPVRVTYNAGFATIPLPVQEATAIYLAKLFDDSTRDLAMVSETAGRANYSVDPNRRPDLPPEAKDKLTPYRITRV